MVSPAFSSFADEAAQQLITFLTEQLSGTTGIEGPSDNQPTLPLEVTFSDGSKLHVVVTVDKSEVQSCLDMSHIWHDWFGDGLKNEPPAPIDRLLTVSALMHKIIDLGSTGREALELRHEITNALLAEDLDLAAYNDLLDYVVNAGLFLVYTGREKKIEEGQNTTQTEMDRSIIRVTFDPDEEVEEDL